MKKFILVASAVLASVCTEAQIVVNSSGHTTTGTMSIVKTTSNERALSITTTGNDTMFVSHPSCLVATAAEPDVYPYIHYNSDDEDPKFFVNGYGYVYSGQYVSFSDSTGKTNITSLESTIDKLKQLRGVSYHFKSDLKNARMEDPMAATPEIREQISQERTRKRLGLIAQEVEEVFPEAVRTQYDGKKGIIYTDLIGVLIAAINEMDAKYTAQIADLQAQLNATQAVLYANNGTLPQQEQTTPSSGADLSEAVLYQNNPNPFNRETTIAYRLPSDIQSASICIYNLNGQQLKKYELDASVISNSVTADASALTTGMYIYALIIDGQMVASKRMVLTE